MKRLQELAAEHGLPEGAPERLRAVLAAAETEPASISSVRDPKRAADVHVADSLSALTLPALRRASTIADLGSGGGFPAFALAVALPEALVTAVESVGRKCEFMRRAAAEAGIANVSILNTRIEEWVAGADSQDVVTARALAPLNVLVEYAAPLLKIGGSLVAYKGRRSEDEEAAARAAAEHLGMRAAGLIRVSPYPGAGERHLVLYEKTTTTPAGFPRRAGMARKRPLASE